MEKIARRAKLFWHLILRRFFSDWMNFMAVWIEPGPTRHWQKQKKHRLLNVPEIASLRFITFHSRLIIWKKVDHYHLHSYKSRWFIIINVLSHSVCNIDASVRNVWILLHIKSDYEFQNSELKQCAIVPPLSRANRLCSVRAHTHTALISADLQLHSEKINLIRRFNLIKLNFDKAQNEKSH